MINDQVESVEDLREIIIRVLGTIGCSPPYAFLGAPNYDNLGDQLICQGTLDYFSAKLSSAPSYICSREFYDSRMLRDVETVFIQGGGNFGDIWRGHQEFALKVIKTCIGKKVIYIFFLVLRHNLSA